MTKKDYELIADAIRAQHKATLREWIKPGDEIACILRTVSRSGMSRTIDLQKIDRYPDNPTQHRVRTFGYNAAIALGMKYDRDREGIRVSGCGMDMGFALVYALARVLFADGFPCTGEHCPSNDHSNGDRDRTPGRLHSDPGYALRHRWL